MKHAKTALLWTFLLTVATIILRVVSVVRYTDETRDIFGYILAFILLAAVLLFLLLVRKFKQPIDRPVGKRAVIIAFLCLIGGAALALGHLVELVHIAFPFRLESYHEGNDALVWLAVLTCLMGLAGGAYLIFAGVTWLNKKACEPLPFKYASLLPVLWGWLRLAHYTVSYTSASGFDETVYDYGFLIFTLLFLMTFAYFCSGDKTVLLSSLMITALPCVWFGVSGILSAAILSVLPQSAIHQTVHAGNIAQWMDFPLPILAFFLTAYTCFAKRENSPETPPLSTVGETEKEPLLPSKEPILKTAVQESATFEEEEDDASLILPEINEVIDTFVPLSDEENIELEALLKEFSSKEAQAD